MKHRKFIVVFGLFFLFCLAFTKPVMAHEYWIMPSDFYYEDPQWISFDFTAGHDLFHPDENPLHEDFKLEIFKPDGTKGGPPIVFSGMRRAVGDVNLEELGTYLLSAFSLKPSYYTELTDGTWVNLPKDEIDDKTTIVSSGMYVKSIKTFVTIGNPTDDNLQKKNYDIELVPLKNPYDAKLGNFDIRVLKNGERAGEGIEVFYMTKSSHTHNGTSHDEPYKTYTRPSGSATLHFDEPGFWIVYCRLIENAPDPQKADFVNLRGYMLLEVH